MSFDDDKPPTPVGRVEVAVHGSKKKAGRSRPIIVVPREGGELREVTQEDLLAGLVKKTAAETAGVKGYIACAGEGCAAVVKQTNGVRRFCPACATERRREKMREAANKAYAANPEKMRVVARARRAANPEKMREAKRARYAASLEKAREYQRARYAANLEKNREAVRKWRAANLEKKRESDRARHAANPERAREACRAYRAKKKAEREAAKKKETGE